MTDSAVGRAPAISVGDTKIERLRLSYPLYIVEGWEHELNLEKERLAALKKRPAMARLSRERTATQGFAPFWRRASPSPSTIGAEAVARASVLRRLEQFSTAHDTTLGRC